MMSSLNDNFCSSPWFHIRIDPRGYYLPCRWGTDTVSNHHISNTSIQEYFNSQTMKDLRLSLLEGQAPDMCGACRYEDSQHKVSGRQKQLLKSAIRLDRFDQSFCGSPHWSDWQHSYKTHGSTTTQPVDLQIDLGNTCNSACVMCSPHYSSRLAKDWNKLRKNDPVNFVEFKKYPNWSDDPELVEKFISELGSIPNIRYIHFLGGETLYLPSFYDICNRLIELGMAKDISIGTTTNCSVYTDELEHIIKNFKHVHLGLSIETATSLNDYVRWPGKISDILENIQKFVELRNNTNLHLSYRITPSVLTFYHIDSIFKLMLQTNVAAESCNILHTPSCLRPEILPKQLAEHVLERINGLITEYNITPNAESIVNIRNEAVVNKVIAQNIFEYKNLLENYQYPLNVESERTKLVGFLKAFEQIRNNSILEHLPEYEEFLRSYGY